MDRLSIERLQLTNFRSYASLVIETGPEIQVLTGANGAGKTNILEAISLLSPGQGLRGAQTRDFARASGDGSWSIAARVHARIGAVDIGTGLRSTAPGGRLAGGESLGVTQKRIVRVDGETKGSSGVLADYLNIVWLTPAMDGLFTGPASERRTFLDRMIASLDSGYRTVHNRFEKAMQNRNRLLADGVSDHAQLSGFEIAMAEAGVAVAAARRQTLGALAGRIEQRRMRDPNSPFPWATLSLEGAIDTDLANLPAVDVEDGYIRTLRGARERDRAAGRTLDGPHRSDLVVGHGPKAMPARLSSSGEQKSLLLGLVLAHAELVCASHDGFAPILLLDEVTAHLDEPRRAALFAEIGRLDAQAWMTGTDQSAFSALVGKARFWQVEGGGTSAVGAVS
jgi:DNA replication and repair protein RecF